MYYEHFGLTQAPFKITPNTDFFFTGGNRGPVLDALIYAITHGEGIVKVSGEVGSGKTMLCNMLQSRLPDNVESVYLANPSVTPDEVLHAIAFELQLGIDRAADRLEVMHAVQDYLVQRHAEGKRVVVFIEESQSMPLATLEEIRLLSNLETRTDKLLQIVLFGQPELDETLRRPDIRQLRDRIAHSFRLEPLGRDQVREYLAFRMRAAGYKGPEIFTPKVVRKIADASGGLTRRINLIADKALLAAFSEDTHTIQPKHVHAALKDCDFSRRVPFLFRARSPVWLASGVCAGAIIGASVYAAFSTELGPVVPVASAPVQGSRGPLPELRHDDKATTYPVDGKTHRATTRGEALVNPIVSVSSLLPQATDTVARVPNKQSDRTHVDIVSQRLDATRRWLDTAPRHRWTIQLFVATDDTQLRQHLKSLPKFIDIDDVYMYRPTGQNSGRLNVLWGSYATRAEALGWLDELPAGLLANRPYARSMHSLKADVEKSTTAALQ